MVEITDGDYRTYITDDYILIQHTQYEKILSILKEPLLISENNSEIIRDVKSSQILKPHAILGIIQIENYNFIIFVKAAFFIGKIEEAEIFRVKEVELIPLVHLNKIENLSSEIKSQVLGIKNLLTLGFFYSFNYDLTNSTQKLEKLKSLDIFCSANRKYFWNYCLYEKFFDLNIDIIGSNFDNFKDNNKNKLHNNDSEGIQNVKRLNNNILNDNILNKKIDNFPNLEKLNIKNSQTLNNPINNLKHNFNKKKMGNGILKKDDSNFIDNQSKKSFFFASI